MASVMSLSRVQLFATPWTVAYQAPLSMEVSRQYYWSGLPFPSPEDLPDPGIEPRFPALGTDALPSEPPGKPQSNYTPVKNKFSSVQFSCSVMSNSAISWTAAHQASLSITNSWSLLKFMSIESVMPSTYP